MYTDGSQKPTFVPDVVFLIHLTRTEADFDEVAEVNLC